MPAEFLVSKAEPWPPSLPDIVWGDEILKPENLEMLAMGGMGYVYKVGNLAYKLNCTQRELDMMKRAGDCAVKPVARVMQLRDGRPVMPGLLMELQTPLDIKQIKESERAIVKDEMIWLIATLHKTYRMVHGDIKPLNMLRCKDGKLRFCDFDSARPIDEDVSVWEGGGTDQYLAPKRNYFYTGSPPTESDDDYALGLSLWELYTGKQALSDQLHNIEHVLKEGRTVNVEEIEDEEVRGLIRELLKRGGAIV